MEPADLTGVVLDGRYRIIEPVAQGAMGVVYRAERIKLGRIVAVKVLHELLPSELSSRRRFEIEAMAMAKLEHPHCAAVVDVGLHEDRPFVVMDFVSGQNLKDVLAAEAPLPIVRAVEILRQILSGLAHAHELGIIHRDIKPANLVLSQKAGLGDHIKVLDFGLARLSQDSSLTTGIAVGTPSYMAPEQIRGAPVDGRVDVYACGVVLFEMLTGTKPFTSERDDPIEVCTMHLKQPPPRLADVRPGVDFGALEGVVARALAKSADERFVSAVEFAAALDAAVPRRAMPTPVAGVPVDPTGLRPAPRAEPAGSPPRDPPTRIDPHATIEHAGVAAPAPAAAVAAAAATVPGGAATVVDGGGGATVTGGAATVVDGGGGATLTSGGATVVDGGGATVVDGGGATVVDGGGGATVVDGGSGAPAATAGGAPRPARQLQPRDVRRIGLIAGGAIVLLVVIVAIVASGGGGPAPSAPAAPPAGSDPAIQVGDPAGETVAHASELIAGGQKSAALDLLVSARKLYPQDARLPYLLGKLYFERLYFTDGIRMFREAIRLEPSYRTDRELIRTVLRGFITTPRAEDDLADFLHDEIGDAAKPFLAETASDHPNALIRERAASELRRYR